MTRYQRFALLIIFGFFSVLTQAQTMYFPSGSKISGVEEMYQKAIYSLMNVEHKKFVGTIQEIIKKDPKCFNALAHRAFHTFHVKQGDYPFEKFAKATLKIKPKTEQEEVYAQILKAKLENPKKDVSYIWNRLAHREKVGEAYFMLGNHYLEVGETKSAHIAFYRLFRLNAAFPPAYNLIAHTSMELNFRQLAEELLISYVNLLPNSPNAHDSLGDFYLSDEKYEDAIQSFEKAYELDKSYKFSLDKAKRAKELIASK